MRRRPPPQILARLLLQYLAKIARLLDSRGVADIGDREQLLSLCQTITRATTAKCDDMPLAETIEQNQSGDVRDANGGDCVRSSCERVLLIMTRTQGL
jgi:hypothetical protein